MASSQVLLVTGTHGNEINGPWLFEQWSQNRELINNFGLSLVRQIGNPKALDIGRRYLDFDLNRSFRKDSQDCLTSSNYEVNRAKELCDLYGPNGSNPCSIAIDLHSTTADMGSCLVIYGRRPVDLAFSSLIQTRLGLPIYLHEGDPSQKGFLVESWSCGLVIEIGPVPQGVLEVSIVEKSRIVISASLEVLSMVRDGTAVYPDQVVVHKHLGSIDFPRDHQGKVTACIHPERQGADWELIEKGSPLFMDLNGEIERFDGKDKLAPVFINEAAYAEKQISMSLTNREVWRLEQSWKEELKELLS